MVPRAFSGSVLLEVARRVGEASTAIALHGSLQDVHSLSLDLSALRTGGLVTDLHWHGLQGFLGSGVPTADAMDCLSAVEGRILGRLVRERAVPAAERERWMALLEGPGGITVDGIWEAHRRIRRFWIENFLDELNLSPVGSPNHVRTTRLERFRPLEDLLGRLVYLKREDEQPVGSFKIRGATNFLATVLLAGYDPAAITVGTASHGNHAQGVVRAAYNLGIRKIEVLLPRNASPLKISQLRALGAKVELFGDTIEDCAAEIERRAARNPRYLFLPAFDQPLVVMGQGSIGVEISLQMAVSGRVDYAVLAPAGGGGLLSGIATFLGSRDPAAAVVGVESKSHPYVTRSFDLGKIVSPEEIRHIDTVADGIALLKIGQAGFSGLLAHLRGVTALSERLIEAALAYMHESGVTLEGAAAVPVAGMLFGAVDLGSLGVPSSAPLVLVASGRNIDPDLLRRIVGGQGEGNWRQLRSRLGRLKSSLEKEGYLRDGRVRNLETADEGIAFVDFLVSKLPREWDLLDALDLLDFGPWTPDKGINATLRSLGQFPERWSRNKEESLTHPESNRGQMLENALRALEQGTTSPERARAMVPASKIDRLRLETHVLELYLDRPDWQERLRPAMRTDGRGVHFAQFRSRNDALKRSIARFLELTERPDMSR